MAYLRGDSYVDGNLVVGGKIQVKGLETSGGDLPYFISPDESISDKHLIMFGDSVGGLQYVPIVSLEVKDYDVDATSTQLTDNHINKNYVLFESSPDKIRAVDGTLYLHKDSKYGDYWSYEE